MGSGPHSKLIACIRNSLFVSTTCSIRGVDGNTHQLLYKDLRRCKYTNNMTKKGLHKDEIQASH
jgi:hypothetical protein